MPAYHKPVMLSESVSALNIDSKKNGFLLMPLLAAATQKRFCVSWGQKGMLIAFDKDSDAIANAQKTKE